jgi:hypothetical protein
MPCFNEYALKSADGRMSGSRRTGEYPRGRDPHAIFTKRFGIDAERRTTEQLNFCAKKREDLPPRRAFSTPRSRQRVT